ncbi:MAG: hypothetical protein JNL98_28955 [Bryobacterales bacterium]|nr:hypothetical protein [Bryobacterales bacterium]
MKTFLVTIRQAKANLSRLLSRVAIGEVKRKRTPGQLKGILKVGPEFFEPLPDRELARWE